MKKIVFTLFILISCFLFSQETKVEIYDSVSVISSRKTLYNHIRNIVQIWVPKADSIHIINTDVKQIDSFGNFEINLNDTNNPYFTINVIAYFSTKFQKKFDYTFRTKLLSQPKITINGLNGYQIMKKEDLVNAEVGLKLEESDYLNFNVKSFAIKIEDNPAVLVEGNRIPIEVVDLINDTKPSEIVIYEINAEGIRHCYFDVLKIRVEDF